MYTNTAIYNSYLTGLEREEAIESAKIDNELERYNMMFEMVNLQLKQNIRDAEFKVFSESGTYDDLTYLCEEAEADAGEKKLNIIQKIFNLIANIFTTVGNTIKNIFNIKGNPEEEIEIDENLIKDHNTLMQGETSWSKIKSGFQSVAAGNFGTGIIQIIDGIKWPALIIAGGAATATVATKIIKKKRGETEGMVKNLDNVNNEAKGIFNTIKSKIDAIMNKPKDDKTLVDFLKDGIADKVQWLMNKFKSTFLDPLNKLVLKIGASLGMKDQEKELNKLNKKEARKNKKAAKQKAKADKKAAKQDQNQQNNGQQPVQSNTTNQAQQTNGEQVVMNSADNTIFGIEFDGFMESSLPEDDDEINDLADMFNSL